jgi:hypothetical protein
MQFCTVFYLPSSIYSHNFFLPFSCHRQWYGRGQKSEHTIFLPFMPIAMVHKDNKLHQSGIEKIRIFMLTNKALNKITVPK